MSDEQARDIRMLAFFIWEKNGCPGGRALDHWLEAEYLVLIESLVEKKDRISGDREEPVLIS